MTDADRDRWNAKYALGHHTSVQPSRSLTELIDWLPKDGNAIDVAGGTGRHAIWLAQRGLTVTVADVSPVALAIAATRATEQAVALITLEIDLQQAEFPCGPWDLIVVVDFVCRSLLDDFRQALAPGGRLVYIHPTRSNLQRHAKPSRRFLFEDGELQQLVRDWKVLHYAEDWSDEGRHEAVLVAEA